jgi:hypothetical protein
MMFPGHPYLKQESNRAVNANQQQIKNTLYQQGLALEKTLHRASHDFEKDPSPAQQQALLIAIGAVQGYLSTRKALAPSVPTENHVRNLTWAAGSALAKINRANTPIEDIENPQI